MVSLASSGWKVLLVATVILGGCARGPRVYSRAILDYDPGDGVAVLPPVNLTESERAQRAIHETLVVELLRCGNVAVAEPGLVREAMRGARVWAPDLLERAREGLHVCPGKVLGEVAFDSVAVVGAGALECRPAFGGEDDEDRAAVMVGADATDEAYFFHPVDDSGEAALAVEDPVGELVHRNAVR